MDKQREPKLTDLFGHKVKIKTKLDTHYEGYVLNLNNRLNYIQILEKEEGNYNIRLINLEQCADTVFQLPTPQEADVIFNITFKYLHIIYIYISLYMLII